MRTIGRCLQLSVACVIAVALAGCGAGYRTSVRNGHETVYHVDDQGNKHLVYEVSKSGEVTIHDETDPRAQDMIKAQELAERAEIAELERIERIKTAPKRPSDDPIRVVFYEMELDDNLRDAQHSEGAISEMYIEEFANDPIVQPVRRNSGSSAELTEFAKLLSGKSITEAPASDVEVVSRGYIKETAGINRSTGKIGKMVVVVFEATITCNYIPTEITVTEEGNILRNAQVMSAFAKKIRHAITAQIGPTIPADRNL